MENYIVCRIISQIIYAVNWDIDALGLVYNGCGLIYKTDVD